MLAEPLYDRQLLAEICIQLSQRRRQLLPKSKIINERQKRESKERRKEKERKGNWETGNVNTRQERQKEGNEVGM